MCGWNLVDLPTCVASNAAGSATSSTVSAGWDDICKSFVTAASNLMTAFAQGFVKIPNVDPADAGISNAYAASLAIGAVVAVLLVFGAIAKTALTHDGTALAQGMSGVAKAVVAWLATAAVATAALSASDEVAEFVVVKTFKSQQAFVARLGNIVNWGSVGGQATEPVKLGQTALGASLALVIALIGIILLIVLWIEMLLRNTALAVLLAVSPIAAAGQASETTKAWWQRTASAAVQLIILKPVVAIVFAVGFAMAGKSQGFEAVLAGLLALGLAVFAWPVIARFFTFATVQSTSSGLATALGFAAGRLSGGGGGTAGVDPSQWSLNAERQNMAAGDEASGGDGLAGAGGGGAAGGLGAAGGSAGGGGGPAGGGGSAAAAGFGFMLTALHRMGVAAAGRMEQTAGHAGMQGAYPYSTVGNGQRAGRPRSRGSAQPDCGAPGGRETGSGAGPADARVPDDTRGDRARDDAVPPAGGQGGGYDDPTGPDGGPRAGAGQAADAGGFGDGTGAGDPGAAGQAPSGQRTDRRPAPQGAPEPMADPGSGGEPGGGMNSEDQP
jgi:hypothetical protein